MDCPFTEGASLSLVLYLSFCLSLSLALVLSDQANPWSPLNPRWLRAQSIRRNDVKLLSNEYPSPVIREIVCVWRLIRSSFQVGSSQFTVLSEEGSLLFHSMITLPVSGDTCYEIVTWPTNFYTALLLGFLQSKENLVYKYKSDHLHFLAILF